MGGGGIFNCKKCFICAILRLYAEFQCPTRLGTGQKFVCVQWMVQCVGLVCKLILMFSIGEAFQSKTWDLVQRGDPQLGTF